MDETKLAIRSAPARWWVFAFSAALAVGCGGLTDIGSGTTLDSGTDGAIVPGSEGDGHAVTNPPDTGSGGTSCDALGDCCNSLLPAMGQMCAQISAEGNDPECADEVATLQKQGDCL